MLDIIQSADASILLFVQENIRCAFLDPVMTLFSFIGNAGILWISLGAILLSLKGYRVTGFDMLLALAMCAAINNLVIKELVMRARPYDTIAGLTTVIAPLSSWSFPSGHASSSFASAYALGKSRGGKWWLLYIPAALIALSRVYVGVHYLSDIAGGALVGTAVSIGVYYLRNRFLRFDKKKERHGH
ncbi:MAG: phosphatase PAP2 family protein [Clostridia bacterium]|nr:phosphatase PAP2 family protein [Clostridia bacterium]